MVGCAVECLQEAEIQIDQEQDSSKSKISARFVSQVLNAAQEHKQDAHLLQVRLYDKM